MSQKGGGRRTIAPPPFVRLYWKHRQGRQHSFRICVVISSLPNLHLLRQTYFVVISSLPNLHLLRQTYFSRGAKYHKFGAKSRWVRCGAKILSEEVPQNSPLCKPLNNVCTCDNFSWDIIFHSPRQMIIYPIFYLSIWAVFSFVDTCLVWIKWIIILWGTQSL